MRRQNELQGGIRHGFSGAVYTSDGPGRVRVTRPDGAVGLFDGIGRWIEGEVYDVDPEMCVWMSINRATVSHRLSSQEPTYGSTHLRENPRE
ncbi:MAG: hypothetical protein HOI67_13735 [Gammaproteobacteria bacterium]|jgi:hypothetical protein|nr:hypothetical protein [Gammaproteobacteria bacterium]